MIINIIVTIIVIIITSVRATSIDQDAKDVKVVRCVA